jgi:hypothetical protein
VTGVGLVFAGNALQNGQDAVALYTGNGADWPVGSAPTTDNLLSALVYDTADADDAALMAALGQATQYDEAGGGSQTTDSLQFDGVSTAPTPGAANFNAIPEPGVWALFAMGGLGAVLGRRKQRRS